MKRLVFAALMAVPALCVHAEEKPKAADADFPQRTNMRADLMKEFDKDGDGKLSEEENKARFEAMRQRSPDAGKRAEEMVKRFDKDGDEKLNVDECKVMIEAMRPQSAGAGRWKEEIIKRYDKDGDGKLSEEEQKTARVEHAKNAGRNAEDKPAKEAK